MIVHHAGKWTGATCAQFLFRLFSRLRVPQPPARISITTDGNPQYLAVLTKQCQETGIDYGRVIKHREGNRLVAVIRERESLRQPDDRLNLNFPGGGIQQ